MRSGGDRAGITGAIVSHALTRAGLETLVVDRRDVGWGSTAASTALLQYEIDVSLVDFSKRLGREHATRAREISREREAGIDRPCRGYGRLSA